MTENEKAIARLMYELTVELFDHQGDEIKALQQANASLQRSHEIIGKLLQETARLLDLN